jgi:hypothetical protein
MLVLSHLARHLLLHQKSVTILQNFGESLMGDVVLFGQSLVVGGNWKFWELGYGLFLRFLSVGGIFNRIKSQKLCLWIHGDGWSITLGHVLAASTENIRLKAVHAAGVACLEGIHFLTHLINIMNRNLRA